MKYLETDVAIIGGGMGGVAAALAALKSGRRVVLTNPNGWLGGQLTSQAVPPDEHIWVEQFGVTASYRALRDGIRDYYRAFYPLTEEARGTRQLNPGLGRVSRLCHEPKVAAAVIEQMLAPYLSGTRLVVLRSHTPVEAQGNDDQVSSVTLEDASTGTRVRITAPFVLDATETGELLPLTGTDYVVGAESREQTGEPSAAETFNPQNVQSITWCFAFDHVDGDNTIEKPENYEYWRSYEPEFWGAPLLSFVAPNPRTLAPETRTFGVNPERAAVTSDQRSNDGDRDLWTFRRILARDNFVHGAIDSDIVLANWPMLDYLEGSIIDTPESERHLAGAKELARCYFYWLQTEAPRPDGGKGWPGLRLRGDVVGTDDGFAQMPYIRESRRILAMRTIVEQDISVSLRNNANPSSFDDSVGVGMYRIDIHPSTGGDNYIDVECAPFEIPLGALIPRRTSNLIAAAKNIGTTHITNGAYRLHPVEWNIGESAGHLAAFCISHDVRPKAVLEDQALLAEFQRLLVESGVEIHWPQITGY